MPVLTISVSTKQEFSSLVSQTIHSGFGAYITTRQGEAKQIFSCGLFASSISLAIPASFAAFCSSDPETTNSLDSILHTEALGHLAYLMSRLP